MTTLQIASEVSSMKRLALNSLASFLICAPAAGAEYPTVDMSKSDTEIELSNYAQVWGDEFDVMSISEPGKGSGPWFTGGHAVLIPEEKMAIKLPDAAYALSSGVLTMSTRVDPADGRRVESHLQTDDGKGRVVQFENGYFETRMWVPAALGSHAGLWLLSQETGMGHTEVDVVETYGTGDPSVHFSTHNWTIDRSQKASRSKRVIKKDIFEGFHLYGVEATSQSFIFYYDRKELGRIARLPEQRVPLYMLLSVFGNPSQPVIDPAVMKVDYMRVYTRRDTRPEPPILDSEVGAKIERTGRAKQ